MPGQAISRTVPTVKAHQTTTHSYITSLWDGYPYVPSASPANEPFKVVLPQGRGQAPCGPSTTRIDGSDIRVLVAFLDHSRPSMRGTLGFFQAHHHSLTPRPGPDEVLVGMEAFSLGSWRERLQDASRKASENVAAGAPPPPPHRLRPRFAR